MLLEFIIPVALCVGPDLGQICNFSYSNTFLCSTDLAGCNWANQKVQKVGFALSGLHFFGSNTPDKPFQPNAITYLIQLCVGRSIPTCAKFGASPPPPLAELVYLSVSPQVQAFHKGNGLSLELLRVAGGSSGSGTSSWAWWADVKVLARPWPGLQRKFSKEGRALPCSHKSSIASESTWDYKYKY